MVVSDSAADNAAETAAEQLLQKAGKLTSQRESVEALAKYDIAIQSAASLDPISKERITTVAWASKANIHKAEGRKELAVGAYDSAIRANVGLLHPVTKKYFNIAILNRFDLLIQLNNPAAADLNEQRRFAQVAIDESNRHFINGNYAAASLPLNFLIDVLAKSKDATIVAVVTAAKVDLGLILLAHEVSEDISVALSAFQGTITAHAKNTNPALRLQVARAQLGSANALRSQGKYPLALIAYNAIPKTLKGLRDAAAISTRLQARLEKEISIGWSKNVQPSVAAIDKIIADTRASTDPTVVVTHIDAHRIHFRRSLADKKMSESAGPIGVIDRVIASHRQHGDVRVQLAVLDAISQKAFSFTRSSEPPGSSTEAIRLYGEVATAYPNTVFLAVMIRSARGLDSKGSELQRQKKYTEALTAFQEVFERLAGMDEPGAYSVMSTALYHTGKVFESNGAAPEVRIAFLDKYTQLLGRSKERDHQKDVLGALKEKSKLEADAKLFQNAIASIDVYLAYVDGGDPEWHADIVSQIVNQAEWYQELGKTAHAVTAYTAAANRFSSTTDVEVLAPIARALMGKASLFVGEGTVLLRNDQHAAASAKFSEAGNAYYEIVSRCANYFQSDPIVAKYFHAAIDLEAKARISELGSMTLGKAKK